MHVHRLALLFVVLLVSVGHVEGSPVKQCWQYEHGTVALDVVQTYDLFGGSLSQGTVVAQAKAVCPIAGTLKNLVIWLTAAPGAGKSLTFTVYKNGVATAMTVTISNTDVTGRYVGPGISVAAGDNVYLHKVGVNAPASVTLRTSCEISGSTAAQSFYAANVIVHATSTTYVNPFRCLHFSTTQAGVQTPVGAAGAITALYACNHGASLTGGKGVDIYVNKNGVRQDGTGGTVNTKLTLTNPATDVATSSAFTLTVARGDAVYLEVVPFGSPSTQWSIGVRFTATTDGESQYAAGAVGNAHSSIAQYHHVTHRPAVGWGSDGVDKEVHCGVTPFTLKKLYVTCTAPGGAATRTFKLRKDQTDPSGGPSLVIAAGATSGSDDVGTFTSADGDGIYVGHTPTGLPFTTNTRWVFVQYIEVRIAGPIPTVQMRTFARLVVGGTDYYVADAPLADDTSWHGGYKPATLLSVSPPRRELSPDGYRMQTVTMVVADLPHPTTGQMQWRGLQATDTIEGAYVALYWVEDTVRRAEGDPTRIFAGQVLKHRALGGFRYELQIEDVLGRLFAELASRPLIPPTRLSLADFPGMDPEADGTCLPIWYGIVSDESETVPQGVVPAVFVGTFNLSEIGGIDKVVDAYLLAEHAVATIYNIYYNGPATPDIRQVVPGASYGVDLVCPHKPNWTTWTGLATQYLTYQGRRLTPIFIDNAHPDAVAVREGRVILSANLAGIESNGDGTGTVFASPEEILEDILNNYAIGRRDAATPFDTPQLDDVPAVDHASFVTAKAVGDARGTNIAGFGIGVDGEPESLFDVIEKICRGADLEIGSNRHGQIMVAREDVTAAAAVTFDAVADIIDGAFNTDIDRELRCNEVEYFYGRRYLPPTAPRPTPAEGDPLPTTPVKPYAEWASGRQTLHNVGAQAAVGRIITRTIDNYVTRDGTTAALVAAYQLARGVGPSPAKDGPRLATWLTREQGLEQDGTVIDLNTVAQLEHPEGLGPTGWTSAAPARARIRVLEIDPLAGTVSLEGRVLEEEDEDAMYFTLDGGTKFVAINEPADGNGTYDAGGVDWVCPALAPAVLATAVLVCEVRTLAAATSITPTVRNVTAGVPGTDAGTGAACTATADTYDGANQRQSVALTLVAGQKYRVRGTVASAGAVAETFMQWRIEVGP